MGERSPEPSQWDSLMRADKVPGFVTLPVYLQCDFLRRHHIALKKALETHTKAETRADREKAIEECREVARALRVEALRTIVRRAASKPLEALRAGSMPLRKS
jgi:hypothetical protein